MKIILALLLLSCAVPSFAKAKKKPAASAATPAAKPAEKPAEKPARKKKFEDESEGSRFAAALPSWLKVSGLVDLRGYGVDRDNSFMRDGVGKTRFGGHQGGSAFRVTMPLASLVLEAEAPCGTHLHLQTNLTADPPQPGYPIGVFEAYAEHHEHVSGGLGLRARAGGYVPELSLEHPGVAWSTRYTLTPSAIGSWIGEDMRVFGAELAAEHALPGVEGASARATAGGFYGGDQIGRLLWYRGWALHDYQADFLARYDVTTGVVKPFSEIDGRPGYYARGDLSFLDRVVELGGGYWTNNGHNGQGRGAAVAGIPGPPGPGGPGGPLGQTAIAGDDEAYRTSAMHVGGKVEWRRLAVLSQLMKVTIERANGGPIDWRAAYLLGSYQWDKWRGSLRYDRFWATNLEYGFGWTSFIGYDFSVRSQLALEWVYLKGNPSESTFPNRHTNRLVQLNYRHKF